MDSPPTRDVPGKTEGSNNDNYLQITISSMKVGKIGQTVRRMLHAMGDKWGDLPEVLRAFQLHSSRPRLETCRESD